MFKNGNATELKGSVALREVRLQPEGVPVNRIVIHHRSDAYVAGFEFYAKDGTVLYKTAFDYAKSGHTFTTQETILQEGERIIGMRGAKYNNSDSYAWHNFLQFVIGKLE